jgi:hypothetical protein
VNEQTLNLGAVFSGIFTGPDFSVMFLQEEFSDLLLEVVLYHLVHFKSHVVCLTNFQGCPLHFPGSLLPPLDASIHPSLAGPFVFLQPRVLLFQLFI